MYWCSRFTVYFLVSRAFRVSFSLTLRPAKFAITIEHQTDQPCCVRRFVDCGLDSFLELRVDFVCVARLTRGMLERDISEQSQRSCCCQNLLDQPGTLTSVARSQQAASTSVARLTSCAACCGSPYHRRLAPLVVSACFCQWRRKRTHIQRIPAQSTNK